jgi:hypothetical protein
MPHRHLLFYSLIIYFIGVPRFAGQAMSSQPRLFGCFDQKSKQKNQAKIITGLVALADRHAAILAGPRASS